jgi:flagellar hook-length control protein FliK
VVDEPEIAALSEAVEIASLTEAKPSLEKSAPVAASAIERFAVSGKASLHGEVEAVKEAAGGSYQTETATEAARIASPAKTESGLEKPVPAAASAIERFAVSGKDSLHGEVDAVKEAAGGPYQIGKMAEGDPASGEASLFAATDGKTDEPAGGRNAPQRLSDGPTAMQRPDIAPEKLSPAGDPAPATWRSTIERVATELASHIKLNKREAVIQLDPPELGKIKIDLRLEGEKLEARIVADVHESRALIESHLQELRQALRSQHVELAEVRVSQGSWSGGAGDSTPGFGQQQPDDGPHWARSSENSGVAASAAPERSGNQDSGREKGRVSMWA